MAVGVTVVAVLVTTILLWFKFRIPFPYRFAYRAGRAFWRTVLVLITLFWIANGVGLIVGLALVELRR